VENFRGVNLDSGIGRDVGRVLPDNGAPSPVGEENVLQIYDTSGRLLFRDFTTRLNDNREIRVRTSADKILGAPVFSVGINPALALQAAVAHAQEVARQNNLSPLALPQAVVSYCYPKLGLLCNGTAEIRYIVDLADFGIYPVDDTREAGVGDPELVGAYSSLDNIPKILIGAQQQRYERFRNAMRTPTNPNAPEAGAEEVQAGNQQQNVAGLTCIAQENSVWCAVACAKMILDFHGFIHTQSEIAATMDPGSAGAPSRPNQVEAYKILSRERWLGAYDDTPGFVEVQNEINAGRPLKNGIPGHARVIAGWKIDNSEENAGSWLHIYDPKEAQIYWEKWGAYKMLNNIFVRPSLIS
jgi:hypothetical protein